MTTKSILIGKFVDHAAPFLWGSVQDASGMTLVAEGLPFVVVNQPPGAKYVNDSLGRLSEVQMTNGTTIVYAYDAAGNRTSTVTTAGPNGL